MLGISAQDVIQADQHFSVYMQSDTGLSDEAEVKLWVRLPRVELQWKNLGRDKDGIGQLYELINRGDTLTDLSVRSSSPDQVQITPAISHGILRSGARIKLRVRPLLSPGFKGVQTELVAEAVNTRFTQSYALQLQPDERIYPLWSVPGVSPNDKAFLPLQKTLLKNARRVSKLDPAQLDWSGRNSPLDLDQNGRDDRWSLLRDDVRWLGDDTNQDGTVDFVHADVGNDGIFDYSAYFKDGAWQETNLVEAWLEMGFSLPWKRSAYHKHDVDILFNETVIGRLHEQIPQGNYSFIIPPQLIRFDDQGRPADNQVGIRSRHLRGGHYVVNSDFRFKFRMTATPMLVIAASDAQARSRLANVLEASSTGVDLSVSTAGVTLENAAAKIQAGDALLAKVPLRNLGAVSPTLVKLVLLRDLPDGKTQTLSEIEVQHPAADGITLAKLPFKAPGGKNSLRIVIDPDQNLPDLDRSNNSASLYVEAEGDNMPPQLKIRQPVNGASLQAVLQFLDVSVQDDQELAQLSLIVDAGLPQPIPLAQGSYHLPLLLQPGAHQLTVIAEDASGNRKQQQLRVEIQASVPQIKILAPTAGQMFDGTVVDVVFSTDQPLQLAAARIAHGPWRKAALHRAGRQWRVQLPLAWGSAAIDVMAVAMDGAVAMSTVNVQGNHTAGRKTDAAEEAIADSGLVWLGSDLDLQIDLFRRRSGVLHRTSLSRAQRAKQLLKAAEYRQSKGDFSGALNKYRESLLLQADAKIEDRAKRLDYYLKIRERQ